MSMIDHLWETKTQSRFWTKVKEVESGCWEWQASKDGVGYGKFYLAGRLEGAHRVSYMMMVDDIPQGLHMDHLCRNPACVNPYHLEPVTVKVNAQRGARGMRTHCPRGHEYTPENTRIQKTPKRESRNCITCARASALASFYRGKNK